MAKYSYEFKKQVVKEYINGEGGSYYLCKKHGVKSHENILKWVNAYKAFGDEGLACSRQNKKYTFEFKLSVVELYLTTKVSYQKLAISTGINNPSSITKWVNDYRIAGPSALREKMKGRRANMDKFKKEDNNDKNKNYLKKLEDENLKLRIENAYLKELRRLRLENEKPNKKRELSAASEENSN